MKMKALLNDTLFSLGSIIIFNSKYNRYENESYQMTKCIGSINKTFNQKRNCNLDETIYCTSSINYFISIKIKLNQNEINLKTGSLAMIKSKQLSS